MLRPEFLSNKLKSNIRSQYVSMEASHWLFIQQNIATQACEEGIINSMEAVNASDDEMGLLEGSNINPRNALLSSGMRSRHLISSVPSLEISLGRQGWQQEPHLESPNELTLLKC